MKQEVRKYTISILGESYTLLSDESESDVIQAAHHVDTLMRELVQKIPHAGNYDKAILAALTLSLRIVTLESERENSKQALKTMIDHIEHATTII